MFSFINLLGRLSLAKSQVGAGTKCHGSWGHLATSPWLALNFCSVSLFSLVVADSAGDILSEATRTQGS